MFLINKMPRRNLGHFINTFNKGNSFKFENYLSGKLFVNIFIKVLIEH